MERKMNQRIIWKRIGAALYDIAIVAMPAGIVTYLIKLIQIDYSIYLFMGYLLIGCIVPLFHDGNTLGDRFFKIRLVALNGSTVTMRTMVMRNFTYIFYISAIIGLRDNEAQLLWFSFLAIGTYLSIFSKKNRYSEYLTGLDFVFKTKYIVETSEKPT